MTLLTTAEVAIQLKLSHSQIKKLVQKGVIPHIKINRSVRIDQADLDRYLKANRVRVNR